MCEINYIGINQVKVLTVFTVYNHLLQSCGIKSKFFAIPILFRHWAIKLHFCLCKQLRLL